MGLPTRMQATPHRHVRIVVGVQHMTHNTNQCTKGNLSRTHNHEFRAFQCINPTTSTQCVTYANVGV